MAVDVEVISIMDLSGWYLLLTCGPGEDVAKLEEALKPTSQDEVRRLAGAAGSTIAAVRTGKLGVAWHFCLGGDPLCPRTAVKPLTASM